MKTTTILLALTVGFATAVQAAEPKVDFNRDIRPILATSCYACHGPDEDAREGELRLDSFEAATADRDGRRVVSPGKPDDSELISRINSLDPEEVMPPPDSGHELNAEQKQLLRGWVKAGGAYDVHWSFAQPQKLELPSVAQKDWARHPLDYFVLSELEKRQLTPSAEADRYHLIRRVSLDLTGLPPTPEQADAFVADQSDDAFAKVVDRLLQSKAFGEHWARMWLDLARYADTKGYEKDRPREIWRYRDWVIAALNDDMPFDQFTTEQLAGDLLPQPTLNQQVATAFHRNTMTNEEGGTDDEEFRVAAVKDRVDTTIQVWMGLTMGCAKCHSHKYDPISQRDYYAFYAFFNQTEDSDRESPLLPTPTESQTREIARLEQKMKDAQAKLRVEPEGFAAAFDAWREPLTPLWQSLVQDEFETATDVALAQNADGVIVASGERPEKASWTLTFRLPDLADEKLTSLRLDVLPQAVAGGEWADNNVVISELTATFLASESEPRALKLIRPRADFSQASWDVRGAIDGKMKTGWALSPKTSEPHAAVFDLAKPLAYEPGAKLQLKLEQQYGQQLVLARFRISASTRPAKLLSPTVDVDAGLRETFASQEFPATKLLRQQLDRSRSDLGKLRAKIPKTPVMRELRSAKQRKTQIHNRGNFLDPGEALEPAAPAVFGPFPKDAPKNRLGVARWLMQPDNPLTARVMVNRVWARLFGTGLVKTEEDFGTQGAIPTHPAVLDWLAVDFREQGWSLKTLLRTVVLSSTYRQAAVFRSAHHAADPENRWLGRGARFRLSAETVRDQALAVSGLLTHELGGPSVMPPQPAGVWKSTYSNLKWIDATGPNRYRRALYTYWKRTSPHPAMMAFDASSGEVCQIRRVRTNTPLQALITLNDPAFLEAAGALAKRMGVAKAGASQQDLEQRLRNGFRRVLIRPPTSAELTLLVQLYESMKSEFGADAEAAKQLCKAAGVEPDAGDAAMIAVANALLNLDETVMR